MTSKSANVRRARCVLLGYLKKSNIGCDEAIAIHNAKNYTESKMQKGQCVLPSRGVPPSSEPKMLQINNSIRELLHKKKVLFCSFAGYPDFIVLYFTKNKIAQCWCRVYVKGSSEV